MKDKEFSNIFYCKEFELGLWCVTVERLEKEDGSDGTEARYLQ